MIRKTALRIKIIVWCLVGSTGGMLIPVIFDRFAFLPFKDIMQALSIDAIRSTAVVLICIIAVIDYIGEALIFFNIAGKRGYWMGMFLVSIGTFGNIATIPMTGDMQTVATVLFRILCLFILYHYYRRNVSAQRTA